LPDKLKATIWAKVPKDLWILALRGWLREAKVGRCDVVLERLSD